VGHPYGIFMLCPYQGTAFTKVGYLLVKLTEICSSLVVYKGLRNEAHAESPFADPYAELDVLRIAVEEKAPGGFEYPPGYSHVKAPRLKPSYAFAAATDASGGKERRHGVAHGALQQCKLVHGAVRPTPGVQRVRCKDFLYGIEIRVGQQAVRVEDHEELAAGPGISKVSRWSRSRIGLVVISYVELVAELIHHRIAPFRRAIVDYKDFKVPVLLRRQTSQEFLYLPGTVVSGDDNRIL